VASASERPRHRAVFTLRGSPRPLGIDLRPGSVRQARLEAGLSLAQVAGDKVSRAAIHQVEIGRIRPSKRTLELISFRTGKPVEFILAQGSPTNAVPLQMRCRRGLGRSRRRRELAGKRDHGYLQHLR